MPLHDERRPRFLDSASKRSGADFFASPGAEHAEKEVSHIQFMQLVGECFREPISRGGTLAFLEIQSFDAVERELADHPQGLMKDPELGHEIIAAHAARSVKVLSDRTSLERQINASLPADGRFCWRDNRVLLFLPKPPGSETHQTLALLGRRVSEMMSAGGTAETCVTPAIGYAGCHASPAIEDLFDRAETALSAAKSSLEIEPCSYSRRSEPNHRENFGGQLVKLWSKAPQRIALPVQFTLSLILALGGPFLVYAICDAFGADISGPVYIGVVIVLVITATTIWIEGLLALKPTTPPSEPGSPYPVASVIIPAYLPNEADTIMETIAAFLRLDYPNTVQLIVAYNSPGGRLPVEGELEAMARTGLAGGRFILEPVRVHESTSKAQNVNAVIGRVRGRFVGIFDADHHPRPDSLRRAWRWLSNGWDIVQGRCSIRNGAESWVSRMVAIEFEHIYAVSHPGRARFHGFGIFGGSNGFWRTSVLHETRMRHAMLTEDIDSSIRAVEAGYRIAGDRDLISEELAPTTLGQLQNQRLRWAQGWFQVSLRRILPALFSARVSLRQKLGLFHLLVWRELFPWYSIQVLPIMVYWVWVYGVDYIDWAVPIFLATTFYTFSVGPGQIALTYWLSRKTVKRPLGWFFEYLLVSTIFYSPYKDALSRIAHLKEAMRERAWRVTPRISAARISPLHLVKAAGLIFAITCLSTGAGFAQRAEPTAKVSAQERIAALLGGEVATINAARRAARESKHAESVRHFETAIGAIPQRREELLSEYADQLSYSGRSGDAIGLYRELISSKKTGASERTRLQARLALALTWAKQYAAALQVYDDLTAQTPTDSDLSIRRARVLAWMGRYEEAISSLDKQPRSWSSGPLSDMGYDILMDAARNAALSDQNAAAATLFERAMRQNAARRTRLLREYADQLVFTARPAAALSLYQEVIDNRGTTRGDRNEAKLGLAQALLRTGKPKQAYQLYVATLRETVSPAKAGGKPRSEANTNIRTLLVSTTIPSIRLITAARLAAAADQNQASAQLFGRALAICPDCRTDILLEYADQLTFAGRPKEAVPLYREAVTYSKTPAARRGLSLALTRTTDHKAALKAWDDYLKIAPSDSGAILHQAVVLSSLGKHDAALSAFRSVYAIDPKNNVARSGVFDETVALARVAAQADRNVEAVRLFETARDLDVLHGRTLAREYADQLSFTGKAGAAVSLYNETLSASRLSAADRKSAMKGLANAYAWSNQPESALAAYTRLERAYPSDPAIKWSRLVFAARHAAQTDRNVQSADLFAEAIALDPSRGADLAREYADQLSFTGRSRDAIPLYQLALQLPLTKDIDHISAQKGLAQAYAWAGRHADAKAAYLELAAKHPGDTSLKWNVAVASARLAAGADNNAGAADLFAEAIRLVPERRGEILGEYADKLAFSGQARKAIPLYRELLLVAVSATEVRKTSMSLALALSWNKQPDAALNEYQKVVSVAPADTEARNGCARMLSWMGHQDSANAAYREVLQIDPGNPEALRGLAQVRDWQGRHRGAQTVLAQRLDDEPDDLSARLQLAQSEAWLGRPDKAMQNIDIALGAAPSARHAAQ